MSYEEKYKHIILPLYGKPRDVNIDQEFTKKMYSNHDYSIPNNQRVNFSHINTFSIDPPNCKDADDAFSIYYEYEKLFLAIHIADPTEYIPVNSKLFNDIMKRVTTKYPSNYNPIHLMPNNILEISSLMENSQGSDKKAISVVSEINKDTYLPCGNVNLLFTTLRVKHENSYNYKEASQNIENIDEFNLGIKISQNLRQARSKQTQGTKLSDIKYSHPVFDNSNNTIMLYEDSDEEKQVKVMIEEFAIFANSFVGAYLKSHLNTGIFRACDAKDWLKTIDIGMSGKHMLQDIIQNGIKGEYISSIQSHDLVGMPEYCHFTSPIRRLSDCICHYLLKYIFYKPQYPHYKQPFSQIELDVLSSKCLSENKKDKKIQFSDIKFRLIQYMDSLLQNNEEITLQYYITSYSGLFLNLIICNINHHNIHLSYTIRIKGYNKPLFAKEIKQIKITRVNCFMKYDENTIPELEEEILCE